MLKTLSLLFLICLPLTASAQFAQPFKWNASQNGNNLVVSVKIPDNHYLYADKTTVTVKTGGSNIKPASIPVTKKHTDEFGTSIIIPSGVQKWIFPVSSGITYKIAVKFQGCKGKTETPGICFMPSEKIFEVKTKDAGKSEHAKKDSKADPEKRSNSELDFGKTEKTNSLNSIITKFKIVATSGGYLGKEKFIEFLDSRNSDKASIESIFLNKGALGIILIILLGGLMLNLTPCVLPMIPVNLAIIGAGSSTETGRMKGFIRGTFYGVGIASAYGVLGIVTVLTGAKFGTLNSAAWFNFSISIIFIFLALAMFDIFTIDFSRFSAKFGIKNPEKGALIPVFVLGAIAALLAGACVAPVVIAVLIHSSTLYAEGSSFGLMLPFILGIGMALPWPFAGAGISLLPKPGKWMVKVKQLMGIIIVLVAAYYAYTGYSLLPESGTNVKKDDNSFTVLKQALIRSEKENKPVFIDFWATWCKNCTQMERTTFKSPEVVKKLKQFIVVKFQAEHPDELRTKKLLDKFKIYGLPGYVILKTKNAD